jgi:hypothetical protein
MLNESYYNKKYYQCRIQMHQLQEYYPNLDNKLLCGPEEVYTQRTARLDLFFRFELNKLEWPFQTVNGDIVAYCSIQRFNNGRLSMYIKRHENLE